MSFSFIIECSRGRVDSPVASGSDDVEIHLPVSWRIFDDHIRGLGEEDGDVILTTTLAQFVDLVRTGIFDKL